jgi:hypothetical protein
VTRESGPSDAGTGGNTGDSPWATNDVPVSSGPPEIVWKQQAGDDAPIVISARRAESEPTHNGVLVRPFWTNPRIIAPVVAVALLLVAVVAWQRDNASSGTPTLPIRATTTDQIASTTSLDTLPEPENSYGGPETEQINPATGTLERIDLPPAVAAITQPTELVIQTSAGQIHTLSRPSGTVRTVDLGSSAGGGFGALAASPDGVLVATYGADPIIVPRSSPPRSVDIDQFVSSSGDSPGQVAANGWFRDADGSAVFSVTAYDTNGNGPTEYVVTLDGTATLNPGASIAVYEIPVTASGDRHVNDAGGAYRIDADGTSTQISPGRIVAGSDKYLLLRECDANRACSYSVTSSEGTGEARRRIEDATVLASLDAGGFGWTLSPDGTALAGQATDGSQVVIDLELGPVAAAASISSVGQWWAGDSSGTFLFDYDVGNLSFIDRRSGEEIEFGEEFDQIVAIGVRYPESELVEESVAVEDLTFSAQPAGPIGLDLVTIGRLGGMTFVDLDDAIATTWNAPTVTGRPPRLFPNGQQVVVVAANSNSGYIASFGTAYPLADDAVPQVPLFPALPGEIWARNPAGTATIDQVTVYPFGGPSTGTALTLADGVLLGSDSAGGMVLSSGGDIYTSSGGTVTRLTSGELLAIGALTAFVRECDEFLTCKIVRVDRASGERVDIEAESALGLVSTVDFERIVSLEGSISPDAGVVLVEISLADTVDPENESEWNLIDLVTGQAVSIPEPLEGQPTVWNADSSYAAIATDGAIVLYERATASLIEVQGLDGTRCITAVDANFSAATG